MGLNISGLEHKPGRNSSEIYVRCPYCNDHKFRLGINIKKGIYQCFNCSKTGRVSDVREFSLLSETSSVENFDSLRNRVSNLFKLTSREFDLDYISWPLESDSTPMAYRYMIDRGFSPEEIKKYNLRVGKPHRDESGNEILRIAGRVIFPFMCDGSCVYYIARTLTGQEPKYLNSTGSKSALVYNIDNVKDTCILCEGIISAISAERTTGVPAVAVLGKSASTMQLNRIRSKCSTIYLSFDGDVSDEENENILKRLVRLFDKVYHVKLPYKTDPDELKSEYLKYFESATRIPMFGG